MPKYFREPASKYRKPFVEMTWGSPLPLTIDGTTDNYYYMVITAGEHKIPVVTQVESHSSDGFEDYPIEIPYRIDHLTGDVTLYFKASTTAPFRGYSDLS